MLPLPTALQTSRRSSFGQLNLHFQYFDDVATGAIRSSCLTPQICDRMTIGQELPKPALLVKEPLYAAAIGFQEPLLHFRLACRTFHRFHEAANRLPLFH